MELPGFEDSVPVGFALELHKELLQVVERHGEHEAAKTETSADYFGDDLVISRRPSLQDPCHQSCGLPIGALAVEKRRGVDDVVILGRTGVWSTKECHGWGRLGPWSTRPGRWLKSIAGR